MKLYAAIAHNLSMRDCTYNPKWHPIAEERLAKAIAQLPSGSGFDVTPMLDHQGTPRSEFTISASYHPMDEHGGYTSWVDFTIRVYAKQDMVFPWDLEITTDCRDDSLVDYITETYHETLWQEFPIT